MGAGEKLMHMKGSSLIGQQDNNHAKEENHWMMIMEDKDNDDDNTSNLSLASNNSGESSSVSNGSSTSSLDIVDDASSSSSSSSCSSSNANGPLYELSELMAQLPIKRGLSKFYKGKSQSFTSLSRVTSIEDLAKKETPYRRKMKPCKSYGAGLDSHKSSCTLPKATISKRISRSSFSSSIFPSRRGSFLSSNNRLPPSIPVQKHC